MVCVCVRRVREAKIKFVWDPWNSIWTVINLFIIFLPLRFAPPPNNSVSHRGRFVCAEPRVERHESCKLKESMVFDNDALCVFGIAFPTSWFIANAIEIFSGFHWLDFAMNVCINEFSRNAEAFSPSNAVTKSTQTYVEHTHTYQITIAHRRSNVRGLRLVFIGNCNLVWFDIFFLLQTHTLTHFLHLGFIQIHAECSIRLERWMVLGVFDHFMPCSSRIRCIEEAYALMLQCNSATATLTTSSFSRVVFHCVASFLFSFFLPQIEIFFIYNVHNTSAYDDVKNENLHLFSSNIIAFEFTCSDQFEHSAEVQNEFSHSIIFGHCHFGHFYSRNSLDSRHLLNPIEHKIQRIFISRRRLRFHHQNGPMLFACITNIAKWQFSCYGFRNCVRRRGSVFWQRFFSPFIAWLWLYPQSNRK